MKKPTSLIHFQAMPKQFFNEGNHDVPSAEEQVLRPDASAEQIWQETLKTLRLQMTEATFNHGVQGSYVLEVHNGTWRIGVKDAFVKDWLEKRLFTTITRTLNDVAEREVALEFVVANGQTAPAVDTDTDITPPVEAIGPTLAQETDFYAGKSKMGHWIAEFEYDLLFWSVYLGQAYTFWRYLVAQWVNTVKKKQDFHLLDLSQRKNQGWTQPFKLSYRAATEGLGKRNHAVIPGGVYECHETLERTQLRKRFPDLKVPLRSSCCGAHACHEWRPQAEGGGRCFYWREGLLHKLHRERLLAVDISPTGRATVQVLRVLPLLTPWQVTTGLPEFLHSKHGKWLDRYAEAHFGLTPEQWETITVRRLTPYIFQEDLEIAGYGCPPQNPFRSEQPVRNASFNGKMK